MPAVSSPSSLPPCLRCTAAASLARSLAAAGRELVLPSWVGNYWDLSPAGSEKEKPLPRMYVRTSLQTLLGAGRPGFDRALVNGNNRVHDDPSIHGRCGRLHASDTHVVRVRVRPNNLTLPRRPAALQGRP